MIASILEAAALRYGILILVLIPLLTSAGLAEDRWTSIGPEGEWVNALAVDPSNPLTLYAGGTVATGVFKTTDGGVNWREVGLTLVPVWVLTIDPVDPLTLYAGTAGGVWRTTDGGENWSAFSSGLTSAGIKALAIDPTDRLTLYAGTDAVFKTTDAGESWTAATNGLTAGSVQAIVIDPTDPLTVYAGSSSGVFKSTDGGENWSPIRNGMSGIWVSCLSIDPAEPLRLYAGTGWGGVFRTTDGGESWSAVNNGLTERDIRTLAANPNETMTLYAGTWDGVFKTTDGGENWAPFNTGLDILRVGVLKIDQMIPSTVYAGTDGSGVFTYRGDGLSSIFFPQFADGVTGGLRFQSTLILTNTGPTSPVRVELFRAPNGSPMEITLGALGTGSVFELEMNKGESISLESSGSGELKVGYAQIIAGEAVDGVVVFKRSDPTTNIALYEAGVPASQELTDFSLFVDSSGVRDTGLAIVYPPLDEGGAQTDAMEATIHLRLYDKQYNPVAEKTLDPLVPGSHLARFVYELFDDSQVAAQAREMEGTLVVQSSQPLVAVTVRQNDDPAKQFPQEVPFLTTFPVISGAPEEDSGPESSSSSFFFPQFADGETRSLRLQSTLVLVNRGVDSMVRIELFSTPEGEPMALTLGELGTASVFEFEMKEGESISLPTPGVGDLKVGYARVTTGPSVGGVVVFRQTDLTTGIALFEAGVPASSQLKEFCLFVDSLGVRDTGVAIVYPPEEEGSLTELLPDAYLTLRLYDKQYNFIAEESLDPMAPGSHMARFVRELFSDPTVKSRAREMEGILVVQSDRPLVAVTVRQNDDPMKEFPQEVPILTTFPVMPGAPD